MGSIAKTIVATGLSSGLGLEAAKQLLEQAQPYRMILGVRNVKATESALSAVKYDTSTNSLSVLPLDLTDMKGVKTFAEATLAKLGQDKLDYLLLNAGAVSTSAGINGSKWAKPYIVCHLSQHYLVHLLREKLVASKARIVFVSSGAVRGVTDPALMDEDLKAGSSVDTRLLYSENKFAQLLGAHWWRRQLQGQCTVVAVSPGLIPGTGLGREVDFKLPVDHPDAKSVAEGGANILRALSIENVPEDPEQLFLTSWGDWWPKDVYAKSLDKELQDKWSPSKEEIEEEFGIQA